MTLYFNDTGIGNGDWNDNNNWWDQPGQAGSSGNTPAVDDTLYIETTCNSNVPATLEYYIYITSGATLITTQACILPTPYLITINSSANLDVNTTFNFSGTIVLESGATLNINADFDAFYNTGEGLLSLQPGAICYCNAPSNFRGGAFSAGTTIYIENASAIFGGDVYSSLILVEDATVTISNAGLYTSPSITGTNNTIIFSAGICGTNITASSTTTLNFTGLCTINSIILNYGTTFFSGNIDGSFNFTNYNIINHNNGVLLCLNLTNNGIYNLTGGSISLPPAYSFTNNGTVNIGNAGGLTLFPTSIFTNNGVFTFGSDYTTRFRGRIFPQIPSSAAFGTAILF